MWLRLESELEDGDWTQWTESMTDKIEPMRIHRKIVGIYSSSRWLYVVNIQMRQLIQTR